MFNFAQPRKFRFTHLKQDKSYKLRNERKH